MRNHWLLFLEEKREILCILIYESNLFHSLHFMKQNWNLKASNVAWENDVKGQKAIVFEESLVKKTFHVFHPLYSFLSLVENLVFKEGSFENKMAP